MIHIESSFEEDIKKITVGGDVDASSSIQLDTEIKNAIEGDDKKILVDCSQLKYISSAGLGVFMSYIQDIENNNIRLVIFGLNEKVLNVFEILGLDQLLTLESSLEAAKSYLNEV
ncbi:MAG: STAS domain-containing protein [Cyclobacteriaceae bacterium]|nr:STAS domain-containing protein [Cyclobacteriaceae bacterium]